VVLEKVQMPPGHLLEVVRLARPPARRTRELRPASRAYAQVQLVGLLAGVEVLIE
jgi:hypothetical protein